MLIGSQCQAARVFVEWTREQLAKACSIDVNVIRDFEHRIHEPDQDIKRRIRLALEEAGAAFISEDATGGAGVRLKFNRPAVRAIQRWEGEGGTAGEDDV